MTSCLGRGREGGGDGDSIAAAAAARSPSLSIAADRRRRQFSERERGGEWGATALARRVSPAGRAARPPPDAALKYACAPPRGVARAPNRRLVRRGGWGRGARFHVLGSSLSVSRRPPLSRSLLAPLPRLPTDHAVIKVRAAALLPRVRSSRPLESRARRESRKTRVVRNNGQERGAPVPFLPSSLTSVAAALLHRGLDGDPPTGVKARCEPVFFGRLIA